MNSRTETVFDGTGRPVLVTQYNGTPATSSTTSVYGGDRTTVIPPTGGVETTTVQNVRGQNTELDQWTTKPTVTGSAISGGAARTTTYAYTALGQQASMTTASGTSVAATWTTTYDLAGDVTSKSDPDTGTTTSAYDDAGQLTSTTDAKGQTLTYTYDALGRKTGEYDGAVGPGSESAGWAYDTLQAGQLTSSTRYTSAGNYVVAAKGYDAAGNPTGSVTSVPASLARFASSYATSYTWTSTHLMATQTPAVDASLPSETYRYYYDSHGDATAMLGYVAYASSTGWSVYGELDRDCPRFG